MTSATFRIFVAIAFFLFICWIIFTADTGQVNPYLRQVRSLPYGDKIAHFTLYGLLAFFVNLALNNRRVKIGSLPFLLGALMVGTFAVLEEFTQIAFATRNFELLDMASDLLGISLCSALNRRLSATPAPSEPELY